MTTHRRRPWLSLALALLASSACEKPTTPTPPLGDPAAAAASDAELQAAGDEYADAAAAVPFAAAEVFFELNATDHDLGFQLFLDSDDGWKRVRVLAPGREDILDFETAGRLSRLGLTELRFESVEPSPAEVLQLFPAGEYRFQGRTVEGTQLTSVAKLSHDFPVKPTFSPTGGATVAVHNAVVEWNAPGAEKVEVIIEQDERGDVFDVTVSASTRRLRVPPQFLRAGLEYKIEILSIGENGNRIIVNSTFRTAT